MKTAVFAMIPALLAPVAYAADTQLPPDASAPAEKVTLDRVTISAVRGERDVATIPHMVTVIERETLQATLGASGDLTSALSRLLPSFAPSRQKMTGSSESFRGRSPLILVDGIPQTNPLRDGSRDGFTIDPSLIERIEVVHGANASMGLGATGGIINFITRSAADGDNEIRLNTALTSSNDFDGDGFEYRLGGSLQRKQGAYDVLASAQYQNSGLYYDANGDKIAVNETHGDLMDSESLDLLLKLGMDLSATRRVELMLNRYDLENSGDYRNVPGDRDQGIAATTEKGKQVGDPNRNKATAAALSYSDRDLAGGNFSGKFYYLDRTSLYGATQTKTFQDPAYGSQYDGTGALTQSIYDQSQIEVQRSGVRLSWNRDDFLLNELDWVLGFDWVRDESKQTLAMTGRTWVPEMKFDNYAPFAQLDYALTDRLQLTSGARYETAKLQVDDFTTLYNYGSRDVAGGDDEFSELLTNLGFTYRISDGLNAYISYSEGFNMPDVGLVLRGINTDGQDVDDLVRIKPIITDNYETGFNYQGEALSLKASYFRSTSAFGSRLADTNGDGSYEVIREKTRTHGYELQTAYMFSYDLEIGGYYSKLFGRVDSDKNGSLDSDLGAANISPDKLSAYARYELNGRTSARLASTYYFDRSFHGQANANAESFDGYALVDMSVSYRGNNSTTSLSLGNLLNRDYFDYYAQTSDLGNTARYYKGRGRSLMLAYEHSF